LLITDLTGSVGESTMVDGVVIRSDSPRHCNVDRLVAAHIHSMSAWKITDRRRTNFTEGTEMKTCADVMEEINYYKSNYGVNATAYPIMDGDLLMFRDHAHLWNGQPNLANVTDDGIRHVDDTLLALFYVSDYHCENDISILTSLELTCLWHDPTNAALASLVNGALLQ